MVVTLVFTLEQWTYFLLLNNTYFCIYHGKPSSYFQVLPNRIWLAYIGTTSHRISSLYFPIEKDTKTSLLSLTSLHSFDHYSLYGLRCSNARKFNLWSIFMLAKFIEFHLSIFTLETLLLMCHLMWNRFFFCCFISKSW